MFREKCKILENKKIAPGHFILRLASAKISKNAKPGQFVQILCADPSTLRLAQGRGEQSRTTTSSGLGSYEPLLPRPFSFLTASKKDFSVLYQVVGKGTKILSQTKKGDSLWILGPLGNGFTIERGTRDEGRLLVGGGVGIPPLYHLVQIFLKRKVALKRDIHVFLGAKRKELLLCERNFKAIGVNLHIATDDGSKGKRGFVTELLDDYMSSSFTSRPSSLKIYTCGPTPMLKAVSLISQKYEVPCEVSVEVPMACGFGACLGCAIEVNDSKGRRFAVACTEGPVFEAKEIIW